MPGTLMWAPWAGLALTSGLAVSIVLRGALRHRAQVAVGEDRMAHPRQRRLDGSTPARTEVSPLRKICDRTGSHRSYA